MRRWLAVGGLVVVTCGTAAASAQQPAASPEPGRGLGSSIDVAHVQTTQAAIDILPKPLKAFYRAHRAEMPSQAPEPEFAARGPERRFLVDRLIPFPFLELPRSESALTARFAEKAQGVGRLPWLVQESYARLVQAMKAGDRARILTESDMLAALIVDVHTVVNLTDNYDGQKTGQHGLHVRIADKLPEVLSRNLHLSPDPARYLDDPNEYVFSMILATYVWLDNTLYLDALAKRGKSGYGEIYFEDLARRLRPIVTDRLSSAAEDTGSYWFTAWTAAGRPELR